MSILYFGADYYPEHWPEERWPVDARLMAEAGFNVVRLAEFAWSRLEPADGSFEFTWLDKAIETLHSNGISVILGTPTASPPPWLMHTHPEVFRVREDGQRVTFGNRREYCPNQPVYQDYSRRIVTQMAEHYAHHPAVIGWQIDNEFGERCYCPVCAAAFQEWLNSRYTSLETVNQAWGTIFWSHVYNEWTEIPLPLSTGGSPNPGLALDFRRFASDSYRIYQQMQVDILRARCPDHFITHNFMGFSYEGLNYYDLARDLDLVAWDNYPRTQWKMSAATNPSAYALGHATMRGLKQRNFWLMEQQGGPGGWEMVSVSPRPGELRLWAYQAIAHGADGMVFFRWRTARFGTEQYWHGLLDHDGTPGRRYQEIQRMGKELREIGHALVGAQVRSQVALLQSYDSRFAFQVQPNNPSFTYSGHFNQVYQSFFDKNVSVDVVDAAADLSDYKLVVAPALHVLSSQVAESLARYVRAGGVLVITARSGVKDESNSVVNQRLPGLLSKLCGVEVEEYDSLAPGIENQIGFILPELAATPPVPTNIWSDVLKPTKAQVVGYYQQDYYAGKPAVTLNHFGKGFAIYVGALGGVELYHLLAGWWLELAQVKSLLNSPRKVEVRERWQGKQKLMFVLNHTNQEQTIALDNEYINLLREGMCSGVTRIAPFEVLVLSLPLSPREIGEG